MPSNAVVAANAVRSTRQQAPWRDFEAIDMTGSCAPAGRRDVVERLRCRSNRRLGEARAYRERLRRVGDAIAPCALSVSI